MLCATILRVNQASRGELFPVVTPPTKGCGSSQCVWQQLMDEEV